MRIIELYSTHDCGLCVEAKKLLTKLQHQFPFELREITLTSEHPRYEQYLTLVPVVVIDGTQEFPAPITEQQLLSVLFTPGKKFYIGKFLEALGLVTVIFGFVYGLLGDMWMDLYFFLGGIVIFLAGRMLEKQGKTLPAVSSASPTQTPS